MANLLLPAPQSTLSAVVPGFLLHARAELGFAEQSIIKYQDCLKQVMKILGDRPVAEYGKEDILALKTNMLERHLSVARQVSILSALKRLFAYCQQQDLLVLDPELITIPRRPRREVFYLNTEEVERFVNAIPLTRSDGCVSIAGLRFRALVEVLLGSAMRISEALSLNREQIDFDRREARIVGKGNKERVVFFTGRALFWLKRYLAERVDTAPPVFVIYGKSYGRLKRADIWRFFQRCRYRAGISKRVTPHLLRHTAATQLLFNGCPVGHIKEILGHERLETTCRYYLGLDHRAAKAAHEQYLVYETPMGTSRRS